MIGKEQWKRAVEADASEIDHLTDYLSQRKTCRSFRKKPVPDQATPNRFSTSKTPSRQTPPFHYLRGDLNVLLGPSGGKLLTNTWSKFHLSPAERSPERLKPALMKLFSVAARIAAPRGVGQALKRLVSDFERVYFPIVETPQAESHHKKTRRFALLTVLQEGKGDRLLSYLLDSEPCHSADPTLPSRWIEDDLQLARRRFLFESACRSKSWSEAYRQARLLQARSEPASNSSVHGRFLQLCLGLSESSGSPSKKKQVLTDLAALSSNSPEARLDYALKAVHIPTPDCRAGDIERIVCDALAPADPRWKITLARLYRHSPENRRWMTDFRLLWQSVPSLQPRLKLLLNLLRLPKARVDASLLRRGLKARISEGNNPATVRIRLSKVREIVKQWQEVLPPDSHSKSATGAIISLKSDHWSFILDVCTRLEIEPPVYAKANLQIQPVISNLTNGRRSISLSPEFFALRSSEQKFLMARALFRGAAGLESLEPRLRYLHSPQELYQRARAYAEWMGHSCDPLHDSALGQPDFPTLLVGLEELFWNSGDEAYQRLASIAHTGCWCPLFESEADHFAASFVDIVSASHAMAQTVVARRPAHNAHHLDGLSAIFRDNPNQPVLALRLQRLWVTYLE